MNDRFNLHDLSSEQNAALNEISFKLKRSLSKFPEKYMQNDYYLLHWLMARKFDAKKSEEMLMKHYRYRKALRMDDPEYKDFQPTHIMSKYYPHGFYNYDKEGRPVAYFPIGGVDAKGIMLNSKSSDIYKAIMFWQEQAKWNCEEASQEFGKRIEQATYIVDLMGLSAQRLWKPGLDVFIQILHLVEQHTPEIMYRLYIINAPSIFPIIYNLVKPVLDTKRKIHILRNNYKDALLEIIDKDQLPVHYGGNALDEENDPQCRLHITYGGPVPTSLYNKEKTSSVPDDLKEMNLKAGTQSLVPVTVLRDNSIIKWFVKSVTNNDIFFGGYKCDSTNSTLSTDDMEMIVPYFRTFGYYVPETGQCQVNAGKYIFQFDNTRSWLLNKVIKYSITVLDV